jgi:hypothetical protein
MKKKINQNTIRKPGNGMDMLVPNFKQDNTIDLAVYLKVLTAGDGKTTVLDAKAKEIFVRTLMETANVSLACSRANISRQRAYQIRDKDSEFRAAWDQAVDVVIDMLEQEVFRRGYTGIDKPIYQGGHKVGVIREYSDSLLALSLKAYLPKYRLSDVIVPPNIGTYKVIDVSKLPTSLLEELEKYMGDESESSPEPISEG